MYYDGFHRSFCDDDDDLEIIQESDSIFAFETPETFKLENLRTKRGDAFFICRKCSAFSNDTLLEHNLTRLAFWIVSQEVSLQTWTTTTWSMGLKSAGLHRSCRGPWLLLLHHPIKTLDQKKSSCWCVTEPVLVTKERGTRIKIHLFWDWPRISNTFSFLRNKDFALNITQINWRGEIDNF